MEAVRDEELAVIFREMRRASERSLEKLAERLKTTPATLVALESGEIAALPEWVETSRVVSEYTALLHLDGRPVLRRLEKGFVTRGPAGTALAGEAAPAGKKATLTEAKAVKQAAAAPTETPSPQPLPPKAVKGPPLPPGARAKPAAPAVKKSDVPKPEARRQASIPASEPAAAAADPAASLLKEEAFEVSAPPPPRAQKAQTPGKGRRSRKGAIITWVLLLAVFGAMALGVRHAIQHPAAVWSTVDALPEPAPQVMRSVWELVRPLEDTSQPVPTADPRSQKSDRLPGAGTPQGN